MKTPSVENAVKTFVAEQDEVLRHWKAQYDLRHQLSSDDMRHACTLALLSAARNWELFRSDWHLRAAASDASVLKAHLQARLLNIAGDSGEAGRRLVDGLNAAGVGIDLHLDRYPTLATVQSLLDGGDQNLTFSDQKASVTAARQQLAPRFANRIVALTHDDWRVIELVTATRNAIAHGSVRSVDRMNGAIDAMRNTSNASLRALARPKNRVRRSGIGAYLNSFVATTPPDPNRRVVLLCRHLQDVAQRLA